VNKLKPYIYLLLIPVSFIAGCAGPQPLITTRPTLTDVCNRNNVPWTLDSISQVVTLKRGSSEAKALVGSSVVVVGSDKVTLSGPITRERNVIYVPVDFETKVIVPLLGTRQVLKQPYFIIVDAGHGGKDPGALGRRGTQEKDINLDIAKRLRDVLVSRGYKVKMTRDTDVFISLEGRSEIASRTRADLFVSVHANSNPSRQVQGLEVYTLRELTYQERIEEQRQRNRYLLFSELSMDRENEYVKRMVVDMLEDYKDSGSPKFASQLANSIPRAARMKNSVVKKAGFNVLRNTLIPAVLVEVGYLTNAWEEEQLRDGSYRQRVAEGIADGITDYLIRL